MEEGKARDGSSDGERAGSAGRLGMRRLAAALRRLARRSALASRGGAKRAQEATRVALEASRPPAARRRAWSRKDRSLFLDRREKTRIQLAKDLCSSAWRRAVELSVPITCALIEGWWAMPVRFWEATRALGLGSPKKWRGWARAARPGSWGSVRMRRLAKESSVGAGPRERRALAERRREAEAVGGRKQDAREKRPG